MLNKDQRERLSLLHSRCHDEFKRKEELKALEDNFWDTSMAYEWLRTSKENPSASLEEFHSAYDQARSKAAVLPQDRYDLASSNAKPNRSAVSALKSEDGPEKGKEAEKEEEVVCFKQQKKEAGGPLFRY